MNFLLEHAPALAIAIPLLAAFAVPLIKKAGKNYTALWAAASLLLTEFIVVALALDVFAGNIRVYVLGATLPSITAPAGFPVRIIIEADAMSAFMAVLCTTIALLACIYSAKSMKGNNGLDKYWALLLLATAAMLGMVLTGDIFSMFVFLELLSISSAALIAFYIRSGEAPEAAFKYMVVSSAAALMVLLAAGLLYSQYYLLNIAALAGSLQFTFLDKVALVLLVAAFALKCGAVPLHMWVPDSYGEAPAPISAVLVVASQASLYALFRISFTLFGAASIIGIIAWAIIIFGLLSMFVGVTMAMRQSDIKRLMAYHAISQTGYMLLGIGVGLALVGNPAALNAFGAKAMAGGIFHIMNHALYKGLLFLTAGAIIYRTGTKNLNEMSGLGHSMPLTAAFFLIGAFAISGIPPFNGFASKLLIYESVFLFNPILSIIAIVVSILTLASFMKVFHSAFTGAAMPKYKDAKEVPFAMLFPMAILAALIILFGLFPDIVLKSIVEPAVQALLSRANYIAGVL